MGFFVDRVAIVAQCMTERFRYGLPEVVGPVEQEVLFILDGVGGFQFGPLLVRRALREQHSSMATVFYDWQFGLTGEIWTDLVWLRRNRLMAARLARKLLAFRRAHPRTVIHLLAFSGGAGIALFACERLSGRRVIETLALAGPAVSPQYNLAPALQAVRRCYALVSRRDRWILGIGTRVFGTTDRKYSPSAGMLGFSMPAGLSQEDLEAYQRCREIRWSPSLRRDGHRGGHTAWVSLPFLRNHLLPILRGEPRLPVHAIQRRPPR